MPKVTCTQKPLLVLALVLLTNLFLPTKGLAQAKITYFKASKGYSISSTTGRATQPLDTDDAVLFDASNLQIIIISETAQVYKITNELLKQSDSGNPYLEYSVVRADGKKATITYLQTVEKTRDITTRVIINDYQYPISVLDGTIRKVF